MNLCYRIYSWLNRMILSPEQYARKIGVNIGKECSINTHFWGSEPYLVIIGNHVQITDNVHFLTYGGGWALRKEIPNMDTFGKIIIGDNVYIGSGTYLLPGVTIGSNVVIGACSIVTKSIPDNVVVAGNPARVVKKIDDYRRSMVMNNVETKGMNYEDKKERLMEIQSSRLIQKKYLDDLF